MSLSPVDIARHEFSRAMRGYNMSEVRVFLEAIAAEMTQLQVRLSEAEEGMRSMNKQIANFREMEGTIRDAVVAAQQGMRDSKALTERERETILAEARVEAERIVQEGHKQLAAVEEKLRALMLDKDAFVTRLRYLHDSHGNMIKLIENEQPKYRDEFDSTAPE